MDWIKTFGEFIANYKNSISSHDDKIIQYNNYIVKHWNT